MTGLELVFERKAGETGTLFGSVTTMDIAEALQSKGYEIDRRKIVLREAIKETGDYTVQIKLHRDVSLDIPVSVTAEGGARASNEAKTEKSSKATTTTDITDSIAETPAVESES